MFDRRPVTRRIAAPLVLVALLSGLAPASVAVAEGPVIAGFDIALPAGNAISGTVEDAGGDPVPNISVTACTIAQDCREAATTGLDGTFTVRGLEPGEYALGLAPADETGNYLSTWHSDGGPVEEIADATLVDATGGDVTGVVATVATGLTISGTVTGQGAGPLAGVLVFATGLDAPVSGAATTNASGEFVIRGLVDNRYILSIRVPQPMNFRSGGVLNGGITKNEHGGSSVFVAGSDVTGVNIVAPAGLRLAGTVTGPDTANGSVAAFGTSSTDASPIGPSGQWTIGGLWSGTYQIVFQGPDPEPLASLFPLGYWSGSSTLTIDQNAAASINLTASDRTGLNAVAPKGRSIAGTVRGDSGQMLEDAYVYMCGLTAGCVSRFTGSGGLWQFDHLPADSYSVLVMHAEHVGGYFGSGGWAIDEAAAKRVTVSSADVSGVNVILPSGATFTGHVSGPNGEDVAGAHVHAAGTGGIGPAASGTGTTDADGDFTLRGLTEDDYRIEVAMEGASDYLDGYYADGEPGNYTAELDAASVIELLDAGIGTSFTPIPPRRVLDTRAGVGLSGAFSANVPRTFQVAGVNPIPAGAVAVTGNVTVVGQTGAGYVSVTPTATVNPSTSTINFPLGDTRANNFTVPLGAAGTLGTVYKAPGGRTAHVIVDITGYFVEADSGNTYTPLATKRVLDTRTNTGIAGALAANAPKTLSVAGANSIPANASAITGNLTVVGQSRAGYVSVTPNPTSSPTTSTINFPAGDVRANGLTAPLNGSGDLSIVYKASSGTAHVILDVTGYYLDDPSGLLYYPLPPGRLVDTRPGILASELAGPFAANSPRAFQAIGRALVPLTAAALTGNVTVVNQTAGGYVSLTVAPTVNPSTSTINFPLGDTRANGITVPLDGDGELSGVFKAPSGRTSHLIIDVTGYFR